MIDVAAFHERARLGAPIMACPCGGQLHAWVEPSGMRNPAPSHTDGQPNYEAKCGRCGAVYVWPCGGMTAEDYATARANAEAHGHRGPPRQPTEHMAPPLEPHERERADGARAAAREALPWLRREPEQGQLDTEEQA